MRGVPVGMKQAHGDGGDFARANRLRDWLQLFVGERSHDAAVRFQPFCHFEAEVARDERLRLVAKQIVQVRSRLPCDFEEVAKAARHD